MTRYFPTLFKNTSTDVDKWISDMNSLWLDVDRAFETLDKTFPVGIRSVNYPPYDIIKTDNGYVISVAVAGFRKEELKVEVNSHSVLTITGKKDSKDDDNYLVKGIASRQFVRKWQLNDGDEVSNVKLEDGLLRIHIKRNEPQETIKQITIE